MSLEDEPILSRKEVAAVLAVSCSTVVRWQRDHGLPFWLRGGRWVIRESELRAWYGAFGRRAA